MKRKRKTIGAMVVIAIAIIATFNIYQSASQENKMSIMALANLEALAEDEYHQGQPGTNWETYTITCTATQEDSSNESWHWDVKTGAYVRGVPAEASGGGSDSNSSNTNYAPITYTKDVCGSGLGFCLTDAPSGHPCS